MSDESGLVLLGVDGATIGPATIEGGVDVKFPGEGVRWTWVLDARHEPYVSLPLESLLERARRNRKRYVLVGADRAKAS